MICVRLQNLKCFLCKTSLNNLAFADSISIYGEIPAPPFNMSARTLHPLMVERNSRAISWCSELVNVWGLKQI